VYCTYAYVYTITILSATFPSPPHAVSEVGGLGFRTGHWKAAYSRPARHWAVTRTILLGPGRRESDLGSCGGW
jgi:hypothetical protein